MKHVFRIPLFILVLLILPPAHIYSQDAISEKAMVAAAHPVASSVGIEILRSGGNAVDAAIATAFALSMAEPNASGIGGGGFMLIQPADGDAVMVDYRETASQKATPQMFYETESRFGELTKPGPHSVGVPGLVACAALVLDRYGTMSFKQIIEPTVRLAEEGITVSEKLRSMIMDKYELILSHPPTSAIYLKDMLPPEPGAVLTNEDLARTLLRLSAEGSSFFYEGDVARSIVEHLQSLGGILTHDDFKSYEAKIRSPLTGSYRGYDIIAAAPATGGGAALIELLNIMEGVDVKAFGHNSADFIHVFTEAMKMVFADKAATAADPDFSAVPLKALTGKRHARRLRKRIDPEKARFDYTSIWNADTERGSTSHLSVVDAHGNMVALTQSINFFFGSGIVAPGTGILLNNHLSDFDAGPGGPNAIEPGKRPTSSIAPTIILKRGKPFMTVGTPGASRIISALAQIIINVVDFGMSIDKAIEAPRVHCVSRTLHVESRIPDDVIEALKSRGHEIQVRSAYDNYFGGAQGILIDPATGRLHGGADSRRDGVAVGY